VWPGTEWAVLQRRVKCEAPRWYPIWRKGDEEACNRSKIGKSDGQVGCRDGRFDTVIVKMAANFLNSSFHEGVGLLTATDILRFPGVRLPS
jgi:hypothetical protein